VPGSIPRTFTVQGYGAKRTDVRSVATAAGTSDYGDAVEVVDARTIVGRGPAWGTATPDLNATVLVWRPGEGQPLHVNHERDVVLVVVDGSGTVTIDDEQRLVAAGMLVVVPRGTTRSIVAHDEGMRCVTVHRRRDGLTIGRPEAPAER
jgi:mannose-6-phosphate isomerase-like protein (cupin superfamily)